MTDKKKIDILQEDKDFRDTICALVTFLEKSEVPIEKTFVICKQVQMLIARIISEDINDKEKILLINGSIKTVEWSKLYLVLDYYGISYLTQLQLIYIIHELIRIAVEIIIDVQKKSNKRKTNKE